MSGEKELTWAVCDREPALYVFAILVIRSHASFDLDSAELPISISSLFPSVTNQVFLRIRAFIC